MAVLQVSINDIITVLYSSRSVIEYLFAKKDNISISQLMNETELSDEQYKRLKSLEVIYEYENTVVLNDSIINMFEDILQIGEVSPGVISDYIMELKRYTSFYQDVHHHKFLSPVKKYLRRLDKSITREIIKLQKSIDDTYKNESNYIIKLRKLDEYREKRDNLISNIYTLQGIINETRSTFAMSGDSQLIQITESLKRTLLENLDYLIEIQTDITDYINKIQYQLEIYQKAQQIKEIKDQGLLNYSTNFHEVVVGLNPIRFNGIKSPRTKISIETLYTDVGQQLCQKVAEKYKVSQIKLRTTAGQLSFNLNEKILDHQLLIDTQGLIDKFMKQKDKDLFQFLCDYKFPKSIGELTLEQKLSLFVELLIEYEKHLNFTFRLNYVSLPDSNDQEKRIGYTVIYPQNIKSNKTTKTIKS